MPEFEPHTRNEALLNAIRKNTGGGTGSVDFEPRTRNEYLLNEIRKNTEGGGGSGLPDVTEADNGKVLKVGDTGVWGTGRIIHWLDGGSTYLPYTQTLLSTVSDAITVMLQNNYMSYTVGVILDSTVAENVQSMAQEILVALGNNETPIYWASGLTGINDMICPLKYLSFDPNNPASNFDLLTSSYVCYHVPGAGYFMANAESSISRRQDNGTTMFVKFDRLVDGAHS